MHWSARSDGQMSRDILDQHLLLAAEPAADARLDDPDTLDGQAQDRRQNPSGVKRHLGRAADDQPIIFVPVADHHMRFERDLLHFGRQIFVFDNVVRLREALANVADVHEDVRGPVALRVGLGKGHKFRLIMDVRRAGLLRLTRVDDTGQFLIDYIN